MFGTDIGFVTDYPAMTKEYGYLSQAGLTFPQILAILTTTPAKLLGFANHTGQSQGAWTQIWYCSTAIRTATSMHLRTSH
jgi:hypothetical protein